eukprot:2959554-Pleurochrysis_carterae.AAC.1
MQQYLQGCNFYALNAHTNAQEDPQGCKDRKQSTTTNKPPPPTVTLLQLTTRSHKLKTMKIAKQLGEISEARPCGTESLNRMICRTVSLMLTPRGPCTAFLPRSVRPLAHSARSRGETRAPYQTRPDHQSSREAQPIHPCSPRPWPRRGYI